MALSWKVLVVAFSLIYVDADPRCTKQGQTNIVCVRGGSDYILKKGLVSDNSRTTNITLRNCRITAITVETFSNLPKLKYIDLSQNELSALEIGTLDEATGVTHFNVSFNKLTTLPVGILDQFSKLEVLDLRGNKINEMRLGVFDTVTNLRHLDLSDNEIVGKDLGLYLFDHTSLLRYLDLSGNDMSGTPETLFNTFTILEFLNFGRSSLEAVPSLLKEPNLSTLKYLILSGNKISNLDEPDAFASLENLEKLDLADNIIESLSEAIFETLKKLNTINLRNNKLKTIPETLFQNLPKLTTVELSHNSLEYVPVNAFRETDLKILNLSYNRLTYLQDNFCLELRNSQVILQEFLFNDNPWQCACLRDILQESKEFKIQYDPVKYQGQVRVCATTQEFNCKRQETINKFYTDMYDNAI